METVATFRLDFTPRGYDCGYGGPLKVFPLLNFLQETAGAHADSLGFGVSRLNAEGRTWMLSRIDLRVDRLPTEGEPVRVETWPAGSERLFALRDFAMRGAVGDPLVRAVFAYLVVDLEARRPLRPETLFGGKGPRAASPHPIEPHGFSVPEAVNPEISFSVSASPRHIDLNGHVSNTHIVDWLVDAVPVDRRGAGLSALRVEFRSELRSGEVLAARWGEAAAPEGFEAGRRVTATELGRDGEVVACAFSAWG